MPRKLSPAQFRATLQKAQRDQKRAIDEYNRKARQYNATVSTVRQDQKRAIENFNREVRNYNSKARAHNQGVQNQRRRLNQELQRQNARSVPQTFSAVRVSTAHFVDTYAHAEQALGGRHAAAAERRFLDLASDEAANSVYLVNALDGDGSSEDDLSEQELQAMSMAQELQTFGEDLVSRWAGALYALSPANPDAARHFCTSAREVMISMLDSAAPDKAVKALVTDCELTDRGAPTRRAKISYLLSRHSATSLELTDAVNEDVNNALSLFRAFNDGTHGHAGRFSITELTAIRTRVEAAIRFIYQVVSVPSSA